MANRIDVARRLELSAVKEVGDFVTGQARGLTVTLEGEAPFTACVVELGGALPIARIVMNPTDLNHPDAVETGDSDFDEAMQVTALATYAPTLQQLLSSTELRAALLAFFKRHPDAEFLGTRVRVPVKEGVTQSLVVETLAIAERVAKRFAEVGFLQSEPAAVLPPTRSLSTALMHIVVGAASAGAAALVMVAGMGLGNESVGLGFVTIAACLGALAGLIVPVLGDSE